MGYDIEVAETAEQPTAVVALHHLADCRPMARPFDDVWAFLRLDGQERLRSDGHNVILYKDGVPHAEVGVIVTEAFDDAGRVTASVLPGATARTVHRVLRAPGRRPPGGPPGAPTTATA